MKTAIITGASQGIGKSIAQHLSKNGYYVVINFKSNEKCARQVLESIEGNGEIFQADVGNWQQMENMVDNIVAKRGNVDLLVCNAGISASGLLIDMTSTQINSLINTNLLGVINACKAVSKHMLSAQSGNIINISSMWGEVGASCESVYSATKGGVIAFTKSLAKELGYNGIRVNAITPGLIDTQMNKNLSPQDISQLISETPCGRVGKVEDIANAVVWLASDKSSFINGQVVGVNGGFII